MEIYDIYNLNKFYEISNSKTMNKEKIEIIKDFNLKVNNNEILCIMGKSGCGKTTLMKILGGLVKPSSGQIFYSGENLLEYSNSQMETYRRRDIGFIFQDYKLLNNMNVKDNIIIPLALDHQKMKLSVKKVEELTDMLKIRDKLEFYPYELSGGQKQRVAICRALANNPRVILADEPTGNLDAASSKMVMNMLLNIKNILGKTVILVTHDKEVAAYCDRVITM